MYFIFDTETSGLPKKRNADFMDDDSYSTCRMVSMAWIVLSESMEVETKGYFVIKPSPGMVISQGSINVHGITNEIARDTGYDFADVVKAFKADIERCTHLVAHNICFDYGVLMHELHCVNNVDMVEHVKRMGRICTMIKGKIYLGAKKWPRLAELYATLFDGAVIENAHNALVDAAACADCFRVIMPRPVASATASSQPRITKLTSGQAVAVPAAAVPLVAPLPPCDCCESRFSQSDNSLQLA